MSNSDQKKLEAAVNKLIRKYGEAKTVRIIKNGANTGLFSTMMAYPNGVFIYCNSELGGVMVGKRTK